MLTIISQLAKRFNPLHKYERCWCLTVFRFGRRKVELCYCPADYESPEHVHPNSDGEFLILWARNRPIYRRTGSPRDSYVANVPPWRLKTLSVRAGIPHAFKKGDSCLIWICFETWKKGVSVTSVAEDLVLT
jgi:hypothetical protein